MGWMHSSFGIVSRSSSAYCGLCTALAALHLPKPALLPPPAPCKIPAEPTRLCLPLEIQILRAECPRGHGSSRDISPEIPALQRRLRSCSSPKPTWEGIPRNSRIAAAQQLPRLGAPRLYLLCSAWGWHTQPGSCEILGCSPRPQMEIGGCTILQPRTDPFLPGAGDATPTPLLLSLPGDRALLERGHRPGWRLGVILGEFGSAGGLSSGGRVKVETLRLPTAHPALGCHPERRLLPAGSSRVRLGKDLSRAGKAARGQQRDSEGEGRAAWGCSDLLSPRLGARGQGCPQPWGMPGEAAAPAGIPSTAPGAGPSPLLPWDLQYWGALQRPRAGRCPFATAASGSQCPGTDSAKQDQHGAPEAATDAEPLIPRDLIQIHLEMEKGNPKTRYSRDLWIPGGRQQDRHRG